MTSMLISTGDATHQQILGVGNWSRRASLSRSTPNSIYGGSQASAQRVYYNVVVEASTTGLAVREQASITGLAVREQRVFTGTPLEQLFSRIRYVHTEDLKLVDPRKHKPNAQNYDLLRTMFKATCVTARVKKMDMQVSHM